MEKAHKNSIYIWMIEKSIFYLFLAASATLIYVFFNEYIFVKKAYMVAIGLLFFLIVSRLIISPIRYKNSNFRLYEGFIMIRTGAFIVEEALVPLRRIQHVDIRSTFVSKFFNLYHFGLYTAGDSHSIEFIDKERAERLKNDIMDYVTSYVESDDDAKIS